jgi:GDPmannose 4,6-dehydratase
MYKKTAIITGISGQDGSYLAEFLLNMNYKVIGIVRRASHPNTARIDHLFKEYEDEVHHKGQLVVLYADLLDTMSLRNIIQKYHPDEFYNLAAQSHVGISFDNASSTINFNTLGPLRILDILRDIRPQCRFYQASSSEMFGSSPPPQNENTIMKPQSPYGIAKLAAFHTTRLYRNAYKMFASNGILFNHESPRRGLNFVTRKITRNLAEIITGERERITLGNLDAKRDWGFSGEYVQAMWKILQHHEPDDFVIATEETHTVKDFLKEAFSLVGLNYEDFLEISDRYKRPAEVPALLGDSTKAKQILGWEPKVKFKELTKMMVAADIREKLFKKGITSPDEQNMDDDFYINKAKELTQRFQKNGQTNSMV